MNKCGRVKGCLKKSEDNSLTRIGKFCGNKEARMWRLWGFILETYPAAEDF